MHPVLKFLVTAIAALGLDLRDRESIAEAGSGLIVALKRVAAFTTNQWDDAACGILWSAWNIPAVQDRIIDAIVAFIQDQDDAPLLAVSAEIFKTSAA